MKTKIKKSKLSDSSPLFILKKILQFSWNFCYELFIATPVFQRFSLLGLSTIWVLRVLIIIILLLLAVDSNFLFLFGRSPRTDVIENPDLALASELYTSDGVLIGRYFIEDRSLVTFEEIPQNIIHALLAAEDIRFFKHKGVELRTPITIVWSALRGESRGGSTITQQLAKNLFKTRYGSSQGILGYIPFVKTVVYKTKEWITAVKLEMLHTKEEILCLYLNTVNFGGTIYGVKIASQSLFSCKPKDLSTEQAALLIGSLKATTTYSPILNPKNALKRRNVVLEQMSKYGFLTKQECDSLCKIPLQLKLKKEKIGHGPAPYFRNACGEFLKQWCKDNGLDLHTSGLKIYTTIDSRMQNYAERVVSSHMRILQNTFDNHWDGRNPWTDRRNREIPGYLDSLVIRSDIYKQLKTQYPNDSSQIWQALRKKKMMKIFSWQGEHDSLMSAIDSIRYYISFLHAGFLAMDPTTGKMKAWVGGIDYRYFMFDHTFQAFRQPGSTFKPFVYCTALENGYTPCDKLMDKPVTIVYKEDGETKSWSPHNSDWTFSNDSITLRHALGRSINTVTAQLTNLVTPAMVVETAHRCGITSTLKSVPSIGLGPDPVCLQELLTSYCPFINGGFRLKHPYFIEKITNSKGEILAQFSCQKERVLTDEIAFLMSYMLKGPIEEPGATGGNLWAYDIFKNNEVAGKTGTSSSHADGWFVGLTPSLIAGAWIGSEDPAIHFRTSELGEGSKTALPLVGSFLQLVYNDKRKLVKPGKFPRPTKKIKTSYICPQVSSPTPVQKVSE